MPKVRQLYKEKDFFSRLIPVTFQVPDLAMVLLQADS